MEINCPAHSKTNLRWCRAEGKIMIMEFYIYD
jgi:hypothetical protein